jgi:hypothetical protein
MLADGRRWGVDARLCLAYQRGSDRPGRDDARQARAGLTPILAEISGALGIVRDSLEVVARRVGRLESAGLLIGGFGLTRGDGIVDLGPALSGDLIDDRREPIFS